MIVDSSAVMAVLNGEDRADEVLALMLGATCRMSVATWLELGIVADSRSAAHGERLNQLAAALRIELVSVDQRQGEVARLAHRRFGRGSGSPARLNFGDCFAYALAVVSGEPLLYVGEDFSHTDLLGALV